METTSNKFGYIDKSGNLIIDTVYSFIAPFKEGLAIARKFSIKQSKRGELGVVDTLGNIIIPFGQYRDIRKFENGCFLVHYTKEEGEIIINDTTYHRVNNFSFNRAIIQDKHKNDFIIKTNGERIETDSIDKIKSLHFKYGLAIASYQDRWGIIDTNGVYIISPTFKNIHRLFDGYFVFYQDGLYGIKDLQGKTIVKPIMKSYDGNGFTDGLLKSVVDKRTAYINKKGIVVWRSSTYAYHKYFQRDIDYINTADYNVEKNKNSYKENGKIFSSKEISEYEKFPSDSLSVVVDKNSLINRIRNKKYLFVHVANRLNTGIEFTGVNGRIEMKAQAKDKNGVWRDIEKRSSASFCGLSIYRGYLNSNHYWTFITPKYEGDFKTKLRIVLEYVDPTKRDDKFKRWNTIKVYSNEYDASVNPAQFWRG